MRRGSTPRGRGRGFPRRGGGQSIRLKGLFDKIWYCDCAPRQPAEHFKVKKEGKNQGRFFYTCQQDADKRCGFFLWAEEAKSREASCVLNNGHGEKAQEGWSAGRADVQSAASPAQSATHASHAGVKRNIRDAGFANGDEDDEAWDLTGAEEKQLAEVADASIQHAPGTPLRGDYTLSAGVYATPTSEVKRSPRKLPWLQEDDPSTSKKSISDFFNTPTTKRVRMLSPEETPAQLKPDTIPTDPDSPSPATRFQDSLQPPAAPEASLSEEVLKELGPLPPEKLAKLRTILRKHESKAEGMRKGRDISRSALKTCQAELREAREKIASLVEEKSRCVEVKVEQSVARDVNGDEETDDEL